jgi:hypothetical protein
MVEAFEMDVRCTACNAVFTVFGLRHRDPMVLRGFTVPCPECGQGVHSHANGEVIPETVKFRVPIETQDATAGVS